MDSDPNVWGDEDDDLFVQASQQVEAATKVGHPSAVKKKAPVKFDGSQMSVLNIRRLELELNEHDGGHVNAENFTGKSVLGNNINNGNRSRNGNKMTFEEIEKLNTQLRSENLTCKGEISNLRRKLQKESEIKQQTLINRQQFEADKKKKETEANKKAQKEIEAMKTDLRYHKGEVQSLKEQVNLLKKRNQAAGVSQSTMGASFSSNSMNMTTSFNNSRSSSSHSKFPTFDAFKAKEVPLSKRTVATATTAMQTNISEPPETKNDLKRKRWKIHHDEKQEMITTVLEHIILKVAKEYKCILPRLKMIAQNAQSDIVESLNLPGFPYDCGFPENIKVTEMMLDEQDRIKRKVNVPVRIPLFPCDLRDWDNIEIVEEGIQYQLTFHRDVWKALCYTSADLMQRVDAVKDERNSLFRANNFYHFIHLLIWSYNLWDLFIPELCESWIKIPEPKKAFKGEIKQWTIMILWVASRHFDVTKGQVVTRSLTLKILDEMIQHKYLIYNETSYERIHRIVLDTMVIARHLNFDNLYRCLQLVRSMDRRKFYLNYMCTKKNDGNCLANKFAEKTLYLFKKMKSSNEDKFRLYSAFLGLLMVLKEYCVVHVNGECKKGQDEDPDEPDDDMDLYLKPSKKNPKRKTPKPNESQRRRLAAGSKGRRDYIDMTVNSMYGSEELEDDESEDEDVLCIDDDDDDEEEHSEQSVYIESQETSSSLMSNGNSSVPSGVTPCGTTVDDDDDVIICDSSEEQMECEQSASSAKKNSGNVEGQPTTTATTTETNNLECKKFLDCCLWEEDKKKEPLKGLCQCRFHLLQTFMIMTEEMVDYWRYVKDSNELEQSKMDPQLKEAAQKRAAEFDDLLKKMRKFEKEGERKATVVKTELDFEFEKLVSANAEYAKQIKQDSVEYIQNSLQADDVADALDTAVEIMYETFLKSTNIIYAFGVEGASALSASCVSILHYLKELNFRNSIQQMVHYLTWESDADFNKSAHEEPDNETTDNVTSTSAQASTSASTRKLNAKLDNLKFDLDNEQIKKVVPAFVLQRVQEFKEWKKAAKGISAENQCQCLEENYKPVPVPRDMTELIRIEKFQDQMTKLWEGADDSILDEEADDDDIEILSEKGSKMNIDDSESEVNLEEVQEIQEDESGSDQDEEEDNESDSGSDEDSFSEPGDLPFQGDTDDIDSDDNNEDWVEVEDYSHFCRPSKLLTDDESEEEELPKVTHKDLEAIFKSSENETKEMPMVAKVKSAKEVCEEIRRNEARPGPAPSSKGPQVGPEEIEQEDLNLILNSSSATLKYKDYYKMNTNLYMWDDYTDEVIPFIE